MILQAAPGDGPVSVAESLTTNEPDEGRLKSMAEQNPSTEPKYPHVKVKLVGHDGNAFSILGHVTRQMRRHGLTDAEVDAFMTEAIAGDYNHLLATAMRWVDVS